MWLVADYPWLVEQRVERWTCDQQVMGSNPTWGKSCVTTYVPLPPMPPSSIAWYRSRGGDAAAGNVTSGLAESNGSLPVFTYRRVDDL